MHEVWKNVGMLKVFHFNDDLKYAFSYSLDHAFRNEV